MAETNESKPNFAVVAAISALLLVGMLFGASLWVLSAIVAGILLGLNQFLAKTWSTKTFATRQGADQEAKIGSRVPISLTITNRSQVPVLWMLVEDLLPRQATANVRPLICSGTTAAYDRRARPSERTVHRKTTHVVGIRVAYTATQHKGDSFVDA